MKAPVVAVFAGGTSSEREVSLGSGQACATALARNFPTRFFDITHDRLPDGIDPSRHVVFLALHGTFGEDGGMQRLLDAAQIEYTGCGAAASALVMDKDQTKHVVGQSGIQSTRGILFSASLKPTVESILEKLGEEIVLKPNAEGSSVGLSLVSGREQLKQGMASISSGDWLAEQRVFGRELAVGVLRDKALGVVEIRPHSGVYDYASKYTKGATDYFAPAPLEPATTAAIRRAAELAYAACGCRDYARVDFFLTPENQFYLLEINTLPGMKETSLLPMSARCEGLDFTALVKEMVTPALQRFHAAAAFKK